MFDLVDHDNALCKTCKMVRYAPTACCILWLRCSLSSTQGGFLLRQEALHQVEVWLDMRGHKPLCSVKEHLLGADQACKQCMSMQVQVDRRVNSTATAQMKPLNPLGLQPAPVSPRSPVSNSAKSGAAPNASYPGQGKQNGVQPMPAGYSGNGKVKV